jgi:DNA-binding MurR/RpiR family transcriptional regulator
MDNNGANFTNRLNNLIPTLNDKSLKIANYFIDNIDNLKYMRLKNIAEKCGVSEPTITRFIRKIGFSSFYNFKMTIASSDIIIDKSNISSHENFVLADIAANDSIAEIMKKIKNEYTHTITLTMQNIDLFEIEKAIEVMSKAQSINFYAVGNSFIAAKHAFLRFYRIGIHSNVYTDPAEMAASAALLKNTDVAIGLSYSGKSEPVVKAISYAKERGIPTIAITGPNNSPLLKGSDIKLSTPKVELDDFQLSSFSRLSQILILDLIYAGVAVRNFASSTNAIRISAAKVRDILKN